MVDHDVAREAKRVDLKDKKTSVCIVSPYRVELFPSYRVSTSIKDSIKRAIRHAKNEFFNLPAKPTQMHLTAIIHLTRCPSIYPTSYPKYKENVSVRVGPGNRG